MSVELSIRCCHGMLWPQSILFLSATFRLVSEDGGPNVEARSNRTTMPVRCFLQSMHAYALCVIFWLIRECFRTVLWGIHHFSFVCRLID